MDTDFQLSLLCYLVQSPHGENYIESINDDTFDLLEFKLASQLLKRYYKIFNRIPGNLAANAFLEEEIQRTELPKKVIKDLKEVFEDIYIPLVPKDYQYVEDQLILNLQDKQINIYTSQYAKGDIKAKELFSKLESVSALTLPGEDEIYDDGGFIVADRNKHKDEQVEGEPTFLPDLNRLTSARGFYYPQLIVFMSGPKHFKTGLLIKLAMEYMRDGYSVYYADGENGARSIRNRMKMAIMECKLEELFDDNMTEDLDYQLKMAGFYMGGDIFVDSYPASFKSIKDVGNRLSYLKEKHNFHPDIIFWDSLSHFIPSRPEDQKRDTRIQSQKVYHEAIALNKRLRCFSFSSSQVNRKAISKKTLDMTDIAEDFGIVMNAHAVFAICATDEEMENDIRRLIPVAQREGVGYRGKNQCLIKIDEKRMIVREAEDENAIDSKTLKDD